MDLTLNDTELRFRDELREWLAANHPGDAPEEEVAEFEFSRRWQRMLQSAGYAGLSWPVEYGGRGATLMEQAIFSEETARAGVPAGANFQGVHNAGPAIVAHGTPAQRERYLGPILTADEIWCQGFSEPEAGSDLAGLRTKAERVDGGFRLKGQKIWTSDGHFARMCIVLARTDPEAPKHKGITYFLMEMDQPGVELRRIKQIDGEGHFNEMFLDDAFVPDEGVLGGVGNGWNVAITTLMHERAGVGVAFSSQVKVWLRRIGLEAAARGVFDDPLMRDRFAQVALEVEVFHLNVLRGLSTQMRQGTAGPEGSLTKWQYSEVGVALAEFAADALGIDALPLSSRWGHLLIRSLAMPIEGGTTEIQKNIIAERVLGLPRAPRVAA